MMRWAPRILLGIVIVGMFFGFRIYTRLVDSEVAKLQVLEILKEEQLHSQDAPYYDALLDAAHDPAFAASYSVRILRQTSVFDRDKYVTLIFDDMSARARKDQKSDVVEGLQRVKAELLSPVSGNSVSPDSSTLEDSSGAVDPPAASDSR